MTVRDIGTIMIQHMTQQTESCRAPIRRSATAPGRAAGAARITRSPQDGPVPLNTGTYQPQAKRATSTDAKRDVN
jgi:hypothetical protein